jgi:hypothetical protein
MRSFGTVRTFVLHFSGGRYCFPRHLRNSSLVGMRGFFLLRAYAGSDAPGRLAPRSLQLPFAQYRHAPCATLGTGARPTDAPHQCLHARS